MLRYIRKFCFISGVLLFILCLPQPVFAENVEALIEKTEDIYVPYGYRVSETAKSVLTASLAFSFSEVLKKAAELLFGALR